jgi:hypothetical protein
MGVKNMKNIKELHVPEIDDEIAFCIGCELSSIGNNQIIDLEKCQERISSILNLNFNKSSVIQSINK